MAERSLTALQLLPALEVGGVERGTLEVADALVRAGHRSLVMSVGGRLVAPLERQGSEHIAWAIGRKSPTTLALVPRLRALLRERRVDVLHARSRLPAWVAYLALRGMGPRERPRFVTTVHGRYSVSRYSEIMTRGERVIAVSESIRDYIEDSYPRCDPRRVRLIPRGIDPAAFPHGFRPTPAWFEAWFAEHPILRGKRILTLPGRLTRLKGHAAFLDLMCSLQAEQDDLHGLIVGGGRPRHVRRLQREARARRLPVTLIGQHDNMRNVYAASAVVLSLSTQPESFGRTALEALSIGVPVVGYAHGGVGEILDKVFPAGMVPPGDETRLAATLRRVLAERPRVAPSDAFALENMLARTLALYSALVGEGSDVEAAGSGRA